MRFRLKTLLIVLTALLIGFGGGIAVEKWRVAREQARIQVQPDSGTVVNYAGMRYSEQIKMRAIAAKARADAKKAAQGATK